MNRLRLAWSWLKRLFQRRRRGTAPTTGPSMAVVSAPSALLQTVACEPAVDSSSGAFFKLDGETLLAGPNFVHAPTFSLYRGEHASYAYPVDGWYWFDSEAEACSYFGIPIPEVADPQDGG